MSTTTLIGYPSCPRPYGYRRNRPVPVDRPRAAAASSDQSLSRRFSSCCLRSIIVRVAARIPRRWLSNSGT